jgi:hypothetical protein
MVKIEHSLKLVTILDETHPTSKQLLALGDSAPAFLEKIFADFLLSENIFHKLNEGNTFAKVELA